MKITLIQLGRKGAGIAYSYEFAQALINQGVNIQCVISLYSENIDRWINLKKNYPNKIQLLIVKTYNSKLGFIQSLFRWSQVYSISTKIKYFNPDFLYIPMISLLAPLLLLNLKKIPLYTTIHDVNQHLGEKNIFIEYLNNLCIKRASKIIVLSRSAIPVVIKKYGFGSQDIIHIPHANFSYYSLPENKQIECKVNKRIMFFGRIVKYKGLGILLEAFKKVLSVNPDIRLRIAGDGELSENEVLLIEELKEFIDLEFRWINDDEVYNLFKDVDITILPYIEASQSGVIPLSYSMGCGVIATDVGGLSEQIFPGAGYIIPPQNVQALSSTILDLYNDTNAILDIKKKAKYIASHEMTWHKSATILIDEFNKSHQ